MQIVTFPELDRLKSVAVAVSGGADSMALAHMLAAYAQSRGRTFKVFALTVDHGLRHGSAAEAAKVAKWLSKWPQVTHTVLRWSGKKPKTRIMEAARAARYALLSDACKAHKTKLLAVAHHADDQAETFFMRLSHGSGVDGLAGMKRVSKHAAGVSLYRPLLDVSHADLVAYCRAHGIKWVEDPTNVNDAYSRSRLRKALADEGLDSKRLASVIRRLANASEALAEIAFDTAQTALVKKTKTSVVFDFAILADNPPEVFLRVLRSTIEEVGKGGYGPRLDRLEEISSHLHKTNVMARATIGGCLLEASPKRNTLKVTRENP